VNSFLDLSRHRSLLSTALAIWLPIAVAVTLVMAVVYVVAQQDLRLSANDPQIRLAEDAAASLANGQAPEIVAGGPPVDMASSLAPYIIVLDDAGHPIASSATLDGQIPSPPDGVFQYVAEHGEERLTWQPRAGIRSAAVIVRYVGNTAGYVLAGRALREIERREDQLLALATLGWTASIVAIFIAALLAAWVRRPHAA
jgi:hypothetical protein